MTTTSFSCCKKTLFAFSAHYFTTAFLPRQPCFLNFSVSLQKVKVPDDIFSYRQALFKIHLQCFHRIKQVFCGFHSILAAKHHPHAV